MASDEELQEIVAKDMYERFASEWLDHWDQLDNVQKRETEAWDIADVVVKSDWLAARVAEAVAAERERAVRIAQEMAGSEPINSSEYSDWADWRAGRRVAAAIQEGE